MEHRKATSIALAKKKYKFLEISYFGDKIKGDLKL